MYWYVSTKSTRECHHHLIFLFVNKLKHKQFTQRQTVIIYITSCLFRRIEFELNRKRK